MAFLHLLFPLNSVPDGNVYPPASAVRACSERIPSRFRVHATQVLLVFLVFSGHAIHNSCAQQLSTVVVVAFSAFFLGGFVRERLVRIHISFGPYCLKTILPRYLYSHHSVIAPWLSK